MKTKADYVREAGIEDGVFDYALPQPWVDQLYERVHKMFSYSDITGNIVWLYDDKASIFGRPFPINFIGKSVLRHAGIKWN